MPNVDDAPNLPRKRGRPRKEQLNVIDGGFAGKQRPEPPHDLTKRQKEIWYEVIRSEPVDFFQSKATQDMLSDLCCHRDTIEQLTKTINEFKPQWMKQAEGMRRLREYLKARGDETRHYSLIATRLRLTNQSRYTPQAAATAGRNSTKVRPWEEEE